MKVVKLSIVLVTAFLVLVVATALFQGLFVPANNWADEGMLVITKDYQLEWSAGRLATPNDYFGVSRRGIQPLLDTDSLLDRQKGDKR